MKNINNIDKDQNRDEESLEKMTLKVTSKIFDINSLSESGFVSFVSIKFENIFFSWNNNLDEQLDRLLDENHKNIVFILDKEGKARLVRMTEEFIQINPDFIYLSKPTRKENAICKKNKIGGVLWEKENLISKGVKYFNRNIHELSINNGQEIQKIYVQNLWRD